MAVERQRQRAALLDGGWHGREKLTRMGSGEGQGQLMQDHAEGEGSVRGAPT